MSMYGLDSSFFEFGFSDPSLIDSISSSYPMIADRRYAEREEENLLKLSNSILKDIKRNSSPPKHRHDGTSPLPLGMDWSPPPRNWDGVKKICSGDSHTGWSYFVKVPSWSILAESRGSEPVVFYRVQVGLQSPEGVTTVHEVLRRYSDFLKLLSDLKQSFRNKKLPPAPPKGLLRFTKQTLLDERRCYLEDWMSKVLSDIDVSRSAPVAYFLELEAVARSSFRESSHHVVSCNSSSSSDSLPNQNDVSVGSGTSASASNYTNSSTSEASEIQSDPCVKHNCSVSDRGNLISENDSLSLTEATANGAFSENNNASLSTECVVGMGEKYVKSSDGTINLDNIYIYPQECTTSAGPNKDFTSSNIHQDNDASSKCSGSVESSASTDRPAVSDLQCSPDTLVVLPLEEQQKMSRLLSKMQQRLVTSKNDVEDLVARLNQETAVKQYLTTKVKDLETELESTKQIGNENLKQALSGERERFNQVQWDMEELKRKCMEMEFRSKADQDEKAHAEETKAAIAKENEALRSELDSAREQLNNLQKCREEAELKSKTDVKLLAREIKSLRSSQSELRQELDRVSKERMEYKTNLEKERTKRDCINAANRNLLHECEVLRSRLKECSVDFLVEQEDKLKMESPTDAVDILATSENRVSLLLAEAQLLAQDVASSSHESDNVMTTDDELRRMLTDVLIDNAVLRKQANSVIGLALNTNDTTPGDTHTSKHDSSFNDSNEQVS